MAANRKKIVILGSTGSVGVSVVKVVSHLADRFEVVGLVARNNLETLAQQAAALGCTNVITSEPSYQERLERLAPAGCRVQSGREAIIDLVTRPDVEMVLCAIIGTGGLHPVLAAINAGKNIAIASKEVLVMAGEIVMREAAAKGVKLLPVDSEHSAIFQCLDGHEPATVSRLILTASGGPFRGATAEQLEKVTLEDALDHPTWNMGKKITVDSASMMNKALEIIEAKWLFNMPPDRIEAVIHPQSIVHSMVEFVDGTILAQMSSPDMRFPIQYALTYPEKVPGGLAPFDFSRICELTFAPPDRKLFPALDFAYEAMRSGGTMPAVMNAANEEAVALFMQRRIGFTMIWNIIEKTMSKHQSVATPTLDEILAADAWAREYVKSCQQ